MTDATTPAATTPEGTPPRETSSGRPARSLRTAGLPAVALVLGLAAAWLLPATDLVQLHEPPPARAAELHATIAGLPDRPLVLVDMDADLGTYPEIRYATRAALADLLGTGARLAFISFSPEGRAIAVAEEERLASLGASPDRLLDLGFRSGAEAALVQLAGNGIGDATGAVADAVRARGRGLAGFDLVLVVGGGEIGPRSWIEQVEPRVPSLKVAAITPTFLLPEVQPYRDAGQLVALLGTLPDDTAYGALVASAGTGGAATFDQAAPSANALLLGMLVAIGVLVVSSAGSLLGSTRGARRGTR